MSRCRPHYEAAIDEDLAWLGIEWEQPVRRQSEHLDDYRAALNRLEADGLIYPSFDSRAEIARLVAAREAQAPWPRDPDGVSALSGQCQDHAAGRACAARCKAACLMPCASIPRRHCAVSAR